MLNSGKTPLEIERLILSPKSRTEEKESQYHFKTLHAGFFHPIYGQIRKAATFYDLNSYFRELASYSTSYER
jgi:hypothetical protein